MFDFLRSNKVFNVYHADGSHSKVTAKTAEKAVELGQQMTGKAVSRAQVSNEGSDYERLQRR